MTTDVSNILSRTSSCFSAPRLNVLTSTPPPPKMESPGLAKKIAPDLNPINPKIILSSIETHGIGR